MKVGTFKRRVAAAVEAFWEKKFAEEGVLDQEDLEDSGAELSEVLDELADHLASEFDGETFETPDDTDG